MKNEKLYHKTLNVLLTAYKDGNLEFGDFEKDAVGNICKESANKLGIRGDKWDLLFYTYKGGQILNYRDLDDSDVNIIEAKELISHTGYTIKELSRVEFAFDNSISYDYSELSETKEGGYIGLLAVLDVLKEIHEVKEEVHEESINRLEEIYESSKAVSLLFQNLHQSNR